MARITKETDLQSIRRFFEFAGYTVRAVNWAVNYGETVPALIVNTDYEGLYPTEKTIQDHAFIKKHVLKYKGRFIAESHPAKVCIYIREKQ